MFDLYEHRQMSGSGTAIGQGLLDDMSKAGWELVTVITLLGPAQTISYWKRPTTQEGPKP